MSGSVRPYAALLPKDVSFLVFLHTLLFYKRGVQLGKIGSNLNHSEVILFTVYHAWMTELLYKLNSKLRGYYNYYGVRGNYDSLASFFYHAIKLLFKWLNRRSQRKSYTWTGFKELLKHFGIAKPRITEKKRHKQLLLFS